MEFATLLLLNVSKINIADYQNVTSAQKVEFIIF